MAREDSRYLSRVGWLRVFDSGRGRVAGSAWIVGGLLCLGLALPGAAERNPEEPHIELLSCEEIPRALELVRASVRITAGPRAVFLGDVRCGAFRPGRANVLFLNGLEESGSLAPRESRTLHSVFPRNSAHSECRCVTAGAFRVADLGDFKEAPMDWEEPAVQFEEGDSSGELALRRERVVIPGTIVRSGPGERHPALGTLSDGERVRVFAMAKGWKEIRGFHEGWIPADASTPDEGPVPELREAIAELHERIRGGDAASLCSLPPAEFRDLVFAWQPERRRAVLHPPWRGLPPADQSAFRRYSDECFGIVDFRILGDAKLAETSPAP